MTESATRAALENASGSQSENAVADGREATREIDSVRIAGALSARLAKRPVERVIAPDAFVARPDFDPSASQIRQWAYNASVDTVVLGRVRNIETAKGVRGWEVETILRSGHSGAERGRHRVIVDNASEIESSVDRLAAAILEDLGYQQVEGVSAIPHRDPRSPEPPILGREDSTPGIGSEPAPSRGSETKFELGKLREEAPIEIKAEEAEIVDRGTDRKLIFQRNVRVHQGDVRLASDSLEAEYRKGESEPDRLVAIGSVQIDQGYRRAKCDRAVYVRLEQKISCQGRAELTQGCDVVRGESIEFDLAGDQAHVLGAASIVIRTGDGQGRSCKSTGRTL